MKEGRERHGITLQTNLMKGESEWQRRRNENEATRRQGNTRHSNVRWRIGKVNQHFNYAFQVKVAIKVAKKDKGSNRTQEFRLDDEDKKQGNPNEAGDEKEKPSARRGEWNRGLLRELGRYVPLPQMHRQENCHEARSPSPSPSFMWLQSSCTSLFLLLKVIFAFMTNVCFGLGSGIEASQAVK